MTREHIWTDIYLYRSYEAQRDELIKYGVEWHIARRCILSDLSIDGFILEIPKMTDTALDAAIEAAGRNDCPHMCAYLLDEKQRRGFKKSDMRL